MLHMSNTPSLYCQINYQIDVVERIHLYYKNKWITRSKRALLLRLPAEDAMCEMDEIDNRMFWDYNDTCNVYMVWLGMALMWFSVLYQMICLLSGSYLNGTFWDKSYVIAICAMFVGAAMMCNVDPINHPTLHA